MDSYSGIGDIGASLYHTLRACSCTIPKSIIRIIKNVHLLFVVSTLYVCIHAALYLSPIACMYLYICPAFHRRQHICCPEALIQRPHPQENTTPIYKRCRKL